MVGAVVMEAAVQERRQENSLSLRTPGLDRSTRRSGAACQSHSPSRERQASCPSGTSLFSISAPPIPWLPGIPRRSQTCIPRAASHVPGLYPECLPSLPPPSEFQALMERPWVPDVVPDAVYPLTSYRNTRDGGAD